ncbi:MAG: hypothetical protein NVS3B12_15750 [Acidimicrobiales bacterium]
MSPHHDLEPGAGHVPLRRSRVAGRVPNLGGTRHERHHRLCPLIARRRASACCACAAPTALRRAPEQQEGIATAEAIGAAYAAHGAELYGFACWALDDAGQGEEAVQETFFRAWRAADRFDPQLGSVRTWLFAICRHWSEWTWHPAHRAHHRHVRTLGLRSVRRPWTTGCAWP